MEPSTHQASPILSSPSQSCVAAACGKPLDVAHSRMPNSDRPNEPNGTRPISTLCPLIRSQSIEPSAMPTENTVRISVTTLSSPCSSSLAKVGICVR